MIQICHLSSVQGRRDERAFTRESLPLVPYGVRLSIIAAHEPAAESHGINLISLPRSRTRFRRITTASRAVRQALLQRADIYHVHSPENIPAALILRLILRRKVVYDTREDFPSMMLTKQYLPKTLRSFARTMILFLEKLAARCLDGFIAADPGTLRKYARMGNSRKLVFYNFPNLRYFPETNGTATKKFDLVYRGGLSERAGTFVLLKALALLEGRGANISLLLFGYTDGERATQSLRKWVEDLGIQRQVTLGGVIPHAEMAQTLSQARIAISPLLSIPKFLNNIPVKVFESWACGLPVISSDLPPIRPFFPRNQLHLLVRPGDADDLANAIQTLLAHPELIEAYGRQGRELVRERYTNAGEAHKLLWFYREVLRT